MSATERAMVVMFADVAGSAGLFERLGNGEATRAVERCLKRMQRSISGHNGYTVQIDGDEMLAAFADAESACLAAIDMQQRIADLPPVSGLKLTIRVGLHAGVVTDDGGKLSGEVITNAARIAGIARREQILCSSRLASELPQETTISLQPTPGQAVIPENGESLSLFYLHWTTQEKGDNPASVFGPSSGGSGADRLCLRYRGKTLLLDSVTPVLTLGRDLRNKLVIDDRKASRRHARIEKRREGYVLIDTSTNGCFVSIAGQPETLVRRREMLLEGMGRICFGSSSSDPGAEGADFEHL